MHNAFSCKLSGVRKQNVVLLFQSHPFLRSEEPQTNKLLNSPYAFHWSSYDMKDRYKGFKNFVHFARMSFPLIPLPPKFAYF